MFCSPRTPTPTAWPVTRGWLIAGIAVAAYVISRGLAKLATREPYDDHDNR